MGLTAEADNLRTMVMKQVMHSASAPIIAGEVVGLVGLTAPAMGGGVDEPSDVVHPGHTQCAPPNHCRQATKQPQTDKHGHHVPAIGALDEAVKRLRLQVSCVAAVPYTLQCCLPCQLLGLTVYNGAQSILSRDGMGYTRELGQPHCA